MDVISKIQALKAQKRWTDYQLSKESGVPYSTINNLTTRKNSPTIYTLESLCKAFGITLTQFFSDEETILSLTDEQKKVLAYWGRLAHWQKEKTFAYMEGQIDSCDKHRSK